MISVALCTYNGEKFLKEQLNSILSQTKQVDEIVIYDDASSDKTLAILENFQKQRPELIRVLRHSKNNGPVKSFEKCIKECKGEIIFLSDQDDVWYENKVKKIIDLFDKEPKALLVFTDGDIIDSSGKMLDKTLWTEWFFDTEIRAQWRNNDIAFDHLVRNKNKITGATVAISSKLKERIFPFRPHTLYWHDAWMGMYAAKEHGLFFIEDSLIKYRVHNNQLVGIRNGSTVIKGKQSKIKNFAKIAKAIKKRIRF